MRTLTPDDMRAIARNVAAFNDELTQAALPVDVRVQLCQSAMQQDMIVRATAAPPEPWQPQ